MVAGMHTRPHLVLSRSARCLGLAAAVSLVASPARADEGQWMPGQIVELDRAKLSAMGLELPLEQLWSDNTGLMRAAVNLSGCSAAFVSAEGLIATNHHCAHGAIQAVSSVEHDYLKDGFLARTRAEELPGKGLSVRVLERIDDVTAEVLAGAAELTDDRARAQAIDRARKQIVDACEKPGGGLRCEVAAFYNMSLFQRFTYRELRDVRLVYAPPSAIGEFGGEIDNWMWPRHTGDFTLLRAYVGPGGEPAERADANVPYKPDVWLPVAHSGVKAGDFVAVLGYPGNTERYLPLSEVERYASQIFPARIDLLGEWVAIFEELGATDPARAIKVASAKKGLANRLKNARGMLAGFAAIGLLERRRAEEAELEKWAADSGDRSHREALPALRKLSEERKDSFAHDYLLEQVPNGPNLLGLAIDLVRRARERQKPDLERSSGYMDRNEKKLWDRQERRLRDFDPEVDAHLLASVIARAQALPAAWKLDAFKDMSPEPVAARPGADGAKDMAAKSGSGRERYLKQARQLIARTKLLGEGKAKALFDAADPAALAASGDPFVALALALAPAIEAAEARAETRAGALSRLGPAYFSMLRKVRSGPVYPDANGTLRLSYASIQGYKPREGLVATPQTTLTGQMAKVTGEDPFTMPERVLAAVPKARESYWADPILGDVPIAFLSTGDTTGGNSGSPVINGRGEFVGLNFDRVWENIAGDFGYSERSRNIVVDVRYLLWLLDKVEDADALLQELGVGGLRVAGARAQVGEGAPGPAAAGPAPAHETCPQERRGCGCASGPESAPWWLVGGLLWLRRRRR
ncbi:Myxococcales GC_trans_RRR domain-containing protein/MYXO-CTERM domain-containing protein [Nannocystis exedens]|uniref:Dipeptidyl-peptidase n=2 Tax=Nannocystis exedens TaxID=54 RepID=A0A1I1XNL3_9BACT|nr:Peptidase S46 [Nannocystis exedens]SFE07373.1 Myxococcales GC_trans_RRR domain-containing protein/MYXO-CTERM domain-containing protein [Nannocystis exedens]